MTESHALRIARVQRQRQLDELGPRPSWWRLFARRAWQREYAAITAVTLDETTMFYRSVYAADVVERLAQQQNAALAFLTKKVPARQFVQTNHRTTGHVVGCRSFTALGGPCDCPPETA